MEANSSTFSFRSIIARLLAGLLFGMLVTAALIKIGEQYKLSSNRNEYNVYSERRFDDFYQIPEGELDMVFIGSSHSYCSFDPENFDSILYTRSHQLGMPQQHPDASYYTLREVYHYQRPAVVVMELFWDMLDDPFVVKQAAALFLVLQNKELEADYLQNVFPLSEKIKYAIPVLNYQQDYFLYQSERLDSFMNQAYGITKKTPQATQAGQEYYASKGYVYCDYQMLPDEYGRTNQFYGTNGKKWDFDKSQKRYLDRIIRLCRENGSKLIFVTAPIANVSLEKIMNYAFIHNKIAAYAKANGVAYIDYNMPSDRPALENIHFRDDAHLNDSGVKIVNAHLADQLKNYFLFP